MKEKEIEDFIGTGSKQKVFIDNKNKIYYLKTEIEKNIKSLFDGIDNPYINKLFL